MKPKSKKVNRAWLHDHMNDPYVKLAQREGYRARAAYKLKEIDEALRLVKPGQLVVDLGATPGAWSQYLRRRFAPEGAAANVAKALQPPKPVVSQADLDQEMDTYMCICHEWAYD